MADNTIIQQGRFTSDGTARILQIRSDVDWMNVYNYTQMSAQNNVGVQYYWQRGFGTGTGIRYYKTGGTNGILGLNLANPLGFTLLDTSVQTITVSPNVITNISNANPPRVTSALHGLVTGDIVRISNADGADQLGGVDFRVTVIDANNFDLTWMAPIATAAAPGAASRIRKISNESYWVPKARYISAITRAANAVVTFTAPHNFTVGQQVRFKIPTITVLAYGMTQLNDLTGNVIAISVANNTITVDIDTTGFGAFAFPLDADIPFTFAEAVPVGENTATALYYVTDQLGDAMRNTAYIGMKLAGGADSPGGANADVMYWTAGKSFSVDNQ